MRLGATALQIEPKSICLRERSWSVFLPFGSHPGFEFLNLKLPSRLFETMSNNNNAAPAGRGGRKRGRNSGAAASGGGQPPQKKRKTQAKRQRKRQARNGRAMTQRGDQLTGKGRTRNSTTNRTEMVIEEDEYIAEVTPSNEPNFANVAYSVNPGQVATFPWLSTIAKNFEKYEFEYLEFYYKREVSEYASNGQTGKVILSFETDASDAPPTTKTQIEATDPHEDAMPCENFSLKVPESMLCTHGRALCATWRTASWDGHQDL
jgi:hypothetical protein